MKKSTGLILLVLISQVVNAEMSSTTTSNSSAISESQTKLNVLENKKFNENPDITDAKLKADSGSLSRYSMKFNFSYAGAPIGDLNNPMQPNPDGTLCVCETNVSGSIGARYRLDPKSSIGIGTGVSALTPLQGAKRYDVKNPFISYDLTSKLDQVQIRNSFSMIAVTNVVYRNIGETSGLGYDNSVVYNLGQSRFAIGLDSSVNYYLFERDYIAKDKTASRYTLGFFPNVKYNFTDTFSMSSSVAISYWNPRSTNDHSVLVTRTISQRLGIGYAFSRDVYFAPYFNFYPGQLSANSTTVNFSTTFSIL